MLEEWDADRELDTDGVRIILADQFPELVLSSIDFLGSGWDFDAYLVDSEFVFRFPRRKEIAEFLENEAKILAIVVPHLSAVTLLPEIVFEGHSTKTFPYPFIAHRFIEGVASDDPSVAPNEHFPTDLGQVLTAIHSIVEEPATINLHGESRKGCSARYKETLELIEPDRQIEFLVPDAYEWLCDSPSIPKEFDGPICFVHNDLFPDHIIVNPETGSLSGIIDWSDAAFGDPVWDFVVLELWKGREFTELVIGHYGKDIDAGFLDRLQFLARTSSLKWLADVIKMKGNIEKHVRWVANAFTL